MYSTVLYCTAVRSTPPAPAPAPAPAPRPLVEVEREILGLDYARVGATLMHQWQLPESLIESTEYHPEPLRAQRA